MNDDKKKKERHIFTSLEDDIAIYFKGVAVGAVVGIVTGIPILGVISFVFTVAGLPFSKK